MLLQLHQYGQLFQWKPFIQNNDDIQIKIQQNAFISLTWRKSHSPFVKSIQLI